MPPPRFVLAFDTALAGCSAALYDEAADKSISESEAMVRGQAEFLVPMINRVVEKAGIVMADIDVIGTTVGPGAFTGLRIGLSTARAFALALDRPAIGLMTVDVLVRQFNATQPGRAVAVILETKRKDFYGRVYDAGGKPITEPLADTAENLAIHMQGNLAVIGDALDRFRQSGISGDWEYIEGYNLPDPAVMARMTAEICEAGGPFPVPEPLYLRGADVSASKRKPREIIQ